MIVTYRGGAVLIGVDMKVRYMPGIPTLCTGYTNIQHYDYTGVHTTAV